MLSLSNNNNGKSIQVPLPAADFSTQYAILSLIHPSYCEYIDDQTQTRDQDRSDVDDEVLSLCLLHGRRLDSVRTSTLVPRFEHDS